MLAYLPTSFTRHSPTESRSADLELGLPVVGRAIESRVQNEDALDEVPFTGAQVPIGQAPYRIG